MRRPELEHSNQGREAVRVVRQAEVVGHVRRATCPWLVPGDNRELVRQGSELGLPHATVNGGAVDEHERRPFADALVGDLEPARLNDLHRSNLHAGRALQQCAELSSRQLSSP